ncbi:MAG: hypothetical protein ACLPLR_17415 [Terriglobales bacterium]
MKPHDGPRHPGPMRVMRVDAEFAGIMVAVAFMVLGIVSMPIATAFVIGTVALGVVVALVLRFIPKKFSRVVLGTLMILVVGVLWWLGHQPGRPRTVSSNALYVYPNNVKFTFHKTGYWLDCWFDQSAKVDRCKLSDEKGNDMFEDVFLPCVGQTPLPQRELVFNTRKTGDAWIWSPDKRINVPLVQLKDGQDLLPQSFYAKAKSEVYCSYR